MAKIEYRVIHDKNVNIVKWNDYEHDVLYDEETDKYFGGVDDMLDFYSIKNWEIPKYAYGCTFAPVELDIDNILEWATDDHHEDILGNIDGIEDLRKAIEKFNSVNESNGSYYEDYKTIVDLT